MQKIIHTIDRIEHFVLVWTILGLALFGFFQVFTRYGLNYSFSWFEELGRYLVVLIAFLGAGIGAKKGTHFSMDLIVGILAQPYQQYLQGLTGIISSAFFFLVSFYSWKFIARMYNFGATSSTMGIRMYIVYLPILVFSVVMGVRFLITGIGFIKKARDGKEKAAGKGV
nr:TRAP transporter small permease [Desulfobacula sp.]